MAFAHSVVSVFNIAVCVKRYNDSAGDNIEIVPLYFAKERPVIYRDGNIIMVDDDRLKLRENEKIEIALCLLCCICLSL